MANIILSYYQVGNVVKFKKPAFDLAEGARAFVYENYDRPGLTGISLITEDGRDLGGFSLQEQIEFLELDYDTGKHYIFKNVVTLLVDFKAGLFKQFFK